MANVELVVKIPKEYYEVIKSIPDNQCTTDMLIIKNGTPLPKGHGRLIDADNLDITTITTDDYSGNEVLDVVLKEDIVNALPIIEADRESEDK